MTCWSAEKAPFMANMEFFLLSLSLLLLTLKGLIRGLIQKRSGDGTHVCELKRGRRVLDGACWWREEAPKMYWKWKSGRTMIQAGFECGII
jgi:hypothetical protein